jgi:hypothetical protein
VTALRLAAGVERDSEHTIAQGIVRSAEEHGLNVPQAGSVPHSRAREEHMTDPTARPGDATDGSRQERAIRKAQLDDWLDDALAATFPASDPVASPPSTELRADDASQRE